MAHTKKSQKEKITNQRSNCFTEEFTLKVGRLKDFYKVVRVLNTELGHGNWTTQGRPVRKIKRVDQYNRIVFYGTRTTDVVFRLPNGYSHLESRIILDMQS